MRRNKRTMTSLLRVDDVTGLYDLHHVLADGLLQGDGGSYYGGAPALLVVASGYRGLGPVKIQMGDGSEGGLGGFGGSGHYLHRRWHDDLGLCLVRRRLLCFYGGALNNLF